MKKNHYCFLLASALVLLLSGCGQPTAVDAYTDINGQSAHFSDHKGRWMIINYWASWCKPCIEEIPELNALSNKHGEKVKLFAVNFDGKQGQELISQSEQLGIEFTTLTADPAAVLGYPRPSVLPTTLIFDPDGNLQHTLLGPQTVESLEHVLSQ